MLQADFHRGVPVVVVELRHPANPRARKRGIGIVDTGASVSAVDRVAAEELGLIPMDATTMLRYDEKDGSSDAPRYGGELRIPSLGSYRLTALGLLLAKYDALALIGNDILRELELTYDGPAGVVTLSKP